jgi:hypothetical protein
MTSSAARRQSSASSSMTCRSPLASEVSNAAGRGLRPGSPRPVRTRPWRSPPRYRTTPAATTGTAGRRPAGPQLRQDPPVPARRDTARPQSTTPTTGIAAGLHALVLHVPPAPPTLGPYRPGDNPLYHQVAGATRIGGAVVGCQRQGWVAGAETSTGPRTHPPAQRRTSSCRWLGAHCLMWGSRRGTAAGGPRTARRTAR